MRQLTLEWRTHFDAAHHLPGYDGPCAQMHGHRWEVLLILGPFSREHLDAQGIAYDFRELKRGDAARVIQQYDHKLLNDLLGDVPPSAENLADRIFDDIAGFAAYGFNKAHAACFGRLTYQLSLIHISEPTRPY